MAYVDGGEMTPAQIAAMRAYLRQWIMSPAWLDAEDLRKSIDGLTTRSAIKAWLESAMEKGIDPL